MGLDVDGGLRCVADDSRNRQVCGARHRVCGTKRHHAKPAPRVRDTNLRTRRMRAPLLPTAVCLDAALAPAPSMWCRHRSSERIVEECVGDTRSLLDAKRERPGRRPRVVLRESHLAIHDARRFDASTFILVLSRAHVALALAQRVSHARAASRWALSVGDLHEVLCLPWIDAQDMQRLSRYDQPTPPDQPYAPPDQPYAPPDLPACTRVVARIPPTPS